MLRPRFETLPDAVAHARRIRRHYSHQHPAVIGWTIDHDTAPDSSGRVSWWVCLSSETEPRPIGFRTSILFPESDL
jgi:hypothetical protein